MNLLEYRFSLEDIIRTKNVIKDFEDSINKNQSKAEKAVKRSSNKMDKAIKDIDKLDDELASLGI